MNEWWHKGCFIQEFEHPQLYGKYEVFEDTDEQRHIGRTRTKKEAIKMASDNEVKNYKHGWRAFV